jgi:hypothetical protein
MRKSNARDLSGLKREVGVLLYAFHVGRGRAITSRRLVERLNHSDVTIRAAISELVTEGQPIGSTADGFFVITSREEATECYRHLESRARKILRRLSGLRRGVLARFGTQLSLEIPGFTFDEAAAACERLANVDILSGRR